MNLSTFTNELKNLVIDYCAEEAEFSRTPLLNYARKILPLSLVNKKFHKAANLSKLGNIYEFLCKYNQFQDNYEALLEKKSQGKELSEKEKLSLRGNPQLMEALLRGSSWGAPNRCDVSDIKKMIEIMPKCTEHVITKLKIIGEHTSTKTLFVEPLDKMRLARARTFGGQEDFTTLTIACLNPYMPLDVIAMIINKSDFNKEQILVMLEDIKSRVSEERFRDIEPLFRLTPLKESYR